MINILLVVAEVIVCYASMILLNKKYKTDGLYVYGIIATFLSCIMNLKQIDLLTITIPIGFGVTTSLVIAGNIITQKRGPEEIKTYLTLILVTSLVSCCFLNLSGLMESSDYNLYANKSYDSIFEYNLRVYAGNIISILLTVWMNSKLYYEIKKIKNKIILSNIFSITITELLGNTIFVLIAYLFDFKAIEIILCIIFRYMIKVLIGIIGTVSIYITNKFN